LRDEAYESLDLDLNGWMDENTHFERWKHTKISYLTSIQCIWIKFKI
jgi:hypothetical protein